MKKSKKAKKTIKLSFVFIFLIITIIAFTNTKAQIKVEYIVEKLAIVEPQKKINNKKISILGNSLCTYEGYSNDYVNTNSTNGSLFINNVEETWWMQAINRTGMKLLVNNSSAGDAVIGSANNRTKELHNNIAIVELQKKINNKKISILGDSICTYEGYSNDYVNTNSTIGNNITYYDGSLFINNVKETWWMQAINRTGMKLLVNNSSAGDAVIGRANDRAKELHNNIKNEYPDIIVVYIGVNDIKDGVSLENFKTNYIKMVNTIREKYKDAEIFLFTHIPYTCYDVSRPVISDEELNAFNNVIREIAINTEKCNIVDLQTDSEITYANHNQFMGDQGLHPNALGMDKITDAFINSLIKKYVN